jgi:hypothetical protein
MSNTLAEKELVNVYAEGLQLRSKLGGSATAEPVFSNDSERNKYIALDKRYKELEAIVSPKRASELTNSLHLKWYGFSNVQKAAVAGGGIGLILAFVALGYFLMKKKG